jgi:hypothetical protein
VHLTVTPLQPQQQFDAWCGKGKKIAHGSTLQRCGCLEGILLISWLSCGFIYQIVSTVSGSHMCRCGK